MRIEQVSNGIILIMIMCVFIHKHRRYLIILSAHAVGAWMWIIQDSWSRLTQIHMCASSANILYFKNYSKYVLNVYHPNGYTPGRDGKTKRYVGTMSIHFLAFTQFHSAALTTAATAANANREAFNETYLPWGQSFINYNFPFSRCSVCSFAHILLKKKGRRKNGRKKHNL